MVHSNKNLLSPHAYTLVELIVVIAILVVLSTVGFVGYSQYTASSRDGARVSDLRAIYQGIGVSVSQKGIAPAPDSPVSIYASTGVLLSLQGSVGESVRQTIGLESGGRDPQDGVGYTYLRFKDKKSVQLLALFESEGWGAKMAVNNPLAPDAYAATDYTDRYPSAFGKKLGVFITCGDNTPVEQSTLYIGSGVNATSAATGSEICVIGNTGSGVSENLSGTGVLARVLSPASTGSSTVAFTCGTTTVTGRSPDTTVYQTVTGADGKCWLKSNLGTANVATSSTDSTAYGWLYQWGRLTDGHQIPTSATALTQSTGDIPGNASFIAGVSDWRSTQNDTLSTTWGGTNGTSSPCPIDWRLPTQTEWSVLVTAAGITNSATAFSSSLKLTTAGHRHISDASLVGEGSIGYYWSASPSTSDAYNLYFNNWSVIPANIVNRAYAFSVRCLKN